MTRLGTAAVDRHDVRLLVIDRQTHGIATRRFAALPGLLGPLETFRRRVDDHLDWWQNTLLRTERPLDVEPVAVTAIDEDEEGLS